MSPDVSQNKPNMDRNMDTPGRLLHGVSHRLCRRWRHPVSIELHDVGFGAGLRVHAHAGSDSSGALTILTPKECQELAWELDILATQLRRRG